MVGAASRVGLHRVEFDSASGQRAAGQCIARPLTASTGRMASRVSAASKRRQVRELVGDRPDAGCVMCACHNKDQQIDGLHGSRIAGACSRSNCGMGGGRRAGSSAPVAGSRPMGVDGVWDGTNRGRGSIGRGPMGGWRP
jgi:hypothetical protein